MNELKESLAYACQPATVWRALRVSAVVGTLLAVINHYDEWIASEASATNILQILFTYLVPYLVSTHGQVLGRRNR